MKEQQAHLKKRVRIALLTFPIVIATLVLGGVFVGFYLTDVLKSSSSLIYPIIFSTLGLIISVLVIQYLAKRLLS